MREHEPAAPEPNDPVPDPTASPDEIDADLVDALTDFLADLVDPTD